MEMFNLMLQCCSSMNVWSLKFQSTSVNLFEHFKCPSLPSYGSEGTILLFKTIAREIVTIRFWLISDRPQFKWWIRQNGRLEFTSLDFSSKKRRYFMFLPQLYLSRVPSQGLKGKITLESFTFVLTQCGTVLRYFREKQEELKGCNFLCMLGLVE